MATLKTRIFLLSACLKFKCQSTFWMQFCCGIGRSCLKNLQNFCFHKWRSHFSFLWFCSARTARLVPARRLLKPRSRRRKSCWRKYWKPTGRSCTKHQRISLLVHFHGKNIEEKFPCVWCTDQSLHSHGMAKCFATNTTVTLLGSKIDPSTSRRLSIWRKNQDNIQHTP